MDHAARDVAPAPVGLASENLFRRSFWLGRVDPRRLAALRIALGALAFADLALRLRDFHAFYTTAGIVAPWPGRLAFLHWSIFDATASPTATLLLFLTGLPIAAAFALGYRTRLAGALLWIFMVSLGNRNPYVGDGGDAVLQTLLFWSVLGGACAGDAMGARASADVWLGRRPAAATVPAAGLRFLQLQVALIYAVTSLAKTGPSWRDGTAVYRAITSSDWARGLAPLLAQHPGLCAALTYATLAIEGAFPLLVLSPWRTETTRAIAVAAGLALHAGIFANMRIGIFCAVMPASYLVLVPASFIDRLWSSLGRAFAPRPARAPATAPPAGRGWWERGRRPLWRLGLLGAQLALIGADQLAGSLRWSLPAPLAVELALISERQNWRMFAPDAPMLDVTWRAPGVLGDGTRVELTDSVVPQLRDRGGFAYSRWRRLRSLIITERRELLLPLGRYVCRRWSGRAPDRTLARFELVAHVQPTLPAEGPPRDEVVLSQRCQ